eukprot:scaffold5041_cov85-Phaeocystis_antarctica.AAC.6
MASIRRARRGRASSPGDRVGGAVSHTVSLASLSGGADVSRTTTTRTHAGRSSLSPRPRVDAKSTVDVASACSRLPLLACAAGDVRGPTAPRVRATLAHRAAGARSPASAHSGPAASAPAAQDKAKAWQ